MIPMNDRLGEILVVASVLVDYDHHLPRLDHDRFFRPLAVHQAVEQSGRP